jgi:carbon-monoxide dehydrogenase medium subunit
MKPVPFDYFAPEAANEAVALLAHYGADARALAGGQSLVPMLALRLARPAVLVDLNRIKPLAGIELKGGELVLGAMTRQADVLVSPLVKANARLLAQALAEVGHPPTRARGTIGGSLSHADPAAELPAAVIALDAIMTIAGVQAERTVAAADFFKGMFETAIAPGELLIEVRIPVKAGRRSGFAEISQRKGDFAILSAAVALDFTGDECVQARVVLGGAGPVPLRCHDSEAALTGRPAEEAAIERAADATAVDNIEFDTPQASRIYRQKIAPALVRRALETAMAGMQQ